MGHLHDVLAIIGFSDGDLYEANEGIKSALGKLEQFPHLIPDGWTERWTEVSRQHEDLLSELRDAISAAAGPRPENRHSLGGGGFPIYPADVPTFRMGGGGANVMGPVSRRDYEWSPVTGFSFPSERNS